MITITETCKYTFTGTELVEIARSQARFHGEMRQAEEQFDNVKADHKATVTKLEADISKCTLRVTSGYEMRTIKCLLLKFRPDKESALIVRTDNGRVLRKRKLEPEEKQMTITTVEPESWAFEADFYEDSTSDIVEMVADHVPLSIKEAQELKGVIDVRPLRPLIEDGKPT
jgi:hypothetical protein